MSTIPVTLISAACFLFIQSTWANDQKEPDPLFQSDEILDVRITAPLTTLRRERPLEDQLPAQIQYVDSNGVAVDLDLRIRARGRFRHRADICRFPPVRLNFKKSTVKNTLFANQDKLKLVTHCQTSSRYTESVLREYLTYRILNIMTDASYKVRLLRITYVNTEKNSREDVRYGFLIEHRNRLAKRLQMRALDIPSTKVSALNADYSNLISLFHYMIGNTDFSQIQAADGERCCHNHVLFQDGDQPIYSIPYDFDQAGIVEARYATPNPQFGLRTVRQRLYRGRCINNERLSATISHYFEQKDAVMALIAEDPTIAEGTRKRVTSYLDGFYKNIASEKIIDRDLIKRCV
jgi:hypothetical protein